MPRPRALDFSLGMGLKHELSRHSSPHSAFIPVNSLSSGTLWDRGETGLGPDQGLTINNGRMSVKSPFIYNF